MSSGQYRRREGFNPVQIKDGMIVRLNKNGTVRAEDKFASQLQNNPEGKYWRIVATSQDIS